MDGGNGCSQSEESDPDLVKMIPFFAEGPWRYTDSNRDLVVERLPVEFWQAGGLKEEGWCIVVGRERSGEFLHGG